MSIVRSIVERIRALFAWWIADIQRRPSLIGKAASLLIGLFVICCVCSVPFAAVRGTGRPAAALPTSAPEVIAAPPTSAPAATEPPPPTAAATEAPVPTLAPTSAPEPTPAPTTAPEPTVAPVAEVPKLTDEERAAVQAIGAHVSTIGTALGKIGTLAQNYENTNDWKVSMAIQTAVVRVEHQALLDLKVPSKIGGLRAAILNATSDCDAAMVKMVSGIDKNSAAELRSASTLMNSCGQKIKEAQPEMDALLAQS